MGKGKKCDFCGKPFIAVVKHQRFCTPDCKKLSYKLTAATKKETKVKDALMRPAKKVRQKEQPCWRCKRAGGFCSWSCQFIPVEGWIAKETTRAGVGKSYRISYCPLFIEEGSA